jgi:hypothetical protein
MTITTEKTTALATAILSDDALTSFLAMPITSQIAGLAVLSHIGGDSAVRDACLAQQVSTLPNRMDIAHTAFAGGNEPLMDYLLDLDSYMIGGVVYPSNGMSLARATELLQAVDDEEWAGLVACGLV